MGAAPTAPAKWEGGDSDLLGALHDVQVLSVPCQPSYGCIYLTQCHSSILHYTLFMHIIHLRYISHTMSKDFLCILYISV